MNVLGLRTFIPTKDFEESKKFYQEFGFELLWENDTLAIVGTNQYQFFLQKAYAKEWAENMMLQLFVDDLDMLYSHLSTFYHKYEGVKMKPIFTADYGRTFHLIDPAGVLWHLTERK
ncbi:MAG: VOC family protein [Candidatus Izemoplasmatales bacterium]